MGESKIDELNDLENEEGYKLMEKRYFQEMYFGEK